MLSKLRASLTDSHFNTLVFLHENFADCLVVAEELMNSAKKKTEKTEKKEQPEAKDKPEVGKGKGKGKGRPTPKKML